MIHTYKMFEKELTEGNHVSYHFMYKYFDTISPENSKLYQYEKQLKETVTKHFDLTGFQNALTTPNTTLKEDACFHVGLHRKFIDDKVRDFFHIKSSFPMIYFTKKVKEATRQSPYKCGYTYDVLKQLNHPLEKQAIDLLNLFKEETSQSIFATHFMANGDLNGNEINFEIIPHYTKQNYFALKNKLIKNFKVKKEVLELYDKKFATYKKTDFHYHVKIKINSEGKTVVKFYRTYPSWRNNPYLNEQI